MPGKSVKNKENQKGFKDLLSTRITEAKLTDVQVAAAAGVSKGLISQLRTGVRPSKKLIPSLAWALRTSPSFFFDDVCCFLKESAFDQPAKPLSEVVSLAKTSVWIVVPRDTDIETSTIEEAFRNHPADRHPLDVFLFTTRSVSDSLRSGQSRIRASLKTPSEILLCLEYPLVIIDAEHVRARRVFRRVRGISEGFHLVEIGESSWSSYLLENLAKENHFRNVAEMAAVEQTLAKNSLVILYTNYFPEEEEDLLYKAVRHNLKENGVRYLYLVPTIDETEAEIAKITYNSLRNRLRAEGIPVSDSTYKLITVDSATLFREGTFVLYATPMIDGNPAPNMLLRQVDGLPARFEPVDRKDLAHFQRTLMNPLMATEEIKNWLDNPGGTVTDTAPAKLKQA